MNIDGASAIVTGGASGLGRATAQRLAEAGAHVVVVDLPGAAGNAVADDLGGSSVFVAADVTNAAQVQKAVDAAVERGPLRVLVHCAGRGGPVRVLDRAGEPGSLEEYVDIINVNLVGTFNTLRLAAAAMARNEPSGSPEDDRGVCILTASVAAWEGQIGQTGYASSKAGIVGMTIVAARDLASKQIRVCTIAPGTFDTPLLARVPQPVRENLAASIPHPRRLGDPDEYAQLAMAIIENGMLNGETIRLDGAIRMAPR
ncbi:SDR family NAD(P)-dependent oxidoreductase [Mycolicibacterium thermoresistibile]|uniref:3-oxoacyl-ACP reductase n=1 Tax=Mycolicibacterium thermoresistibile TaxID=1797 RepID=A0A100XFD7_MYCTH|nr:SDR family NAD(P)-dependent oxidoreductase [Mycolicibacterium thermoresistibile]MCV7191145.1 SDR family NAD(P)-dependent oxidoreductase [Mycolicibacterium thermoresistibile]GAT15507.1 3-oxoacyl-ACP reductase [Mycolicibacterium thermoresistibile]SNW16942.1 short-chain type dehydrogenase/reductase [Mycolicibacterium thermoresistibile]